ncbi:hypothetical protein [Dyadobacter sp. 32]|uniref:hypothetical protein n=1 Tax=Dyadobacter sp. 32 TaxID=538966 RepID=UPI0011EECA2D
MFIQLEFQDRNHSYTDTTTAEVPNGFRIHGKNCYFCGSFVIRGVGASRLPVRKLAKIKSAGTFCLPATTFK